MTRRCVDCGFECPFLTADAHFYRRKTGTFESRCKSCTAIRGQEWKEANRERRRAYEREFYANNPERRGYIRAYKAQARRNAGARPNSRSARVLTGAPVPVAALLPAVAASGLPESTISLAAGYVDSTVTRALKRETVDPEMAVRILYAIDVLPAEVGL